MLVPDEIAAHAEADPRFSLAELEDWEQRLTSCSRCPSGGGACADEDIIPRPGRQPRWDPCTRHLLAERCDRWAGYALARLLERIGVPAPLRHARLDGYEPRTEQQKLALGFARRFVENIRRPGPCRGLVFFGGSGTGKSHLAVATLATLATVAKFDRPDPRAPWLLFRDVSFLLREARQALDTDERDAPMDQAGTVQVLVLDDLGSSRPSEWASEELTVLAKRRQQLGRPTIVTTRDAKRFERAFADFSDAFASASDVIALDGPNGHRP